MRTMRFLVLIGVLTTACLALVAPAVAAPVVTVRVVAPQHVSKGQMVPVKLVVSGGAKVAGIQALVHVNATAAEVGGIAPAGKGRTLNPVPSTGGATLGAYAMKVRSGTIATVAVFPKAQGRVEIKVGRVEVVDASGRRLPVRVVGGSLTVQVGKGTHRYPAKATGVAPLASHHAVKADVDGSGIVDIQDLDQTLYGWAAGNSDGDVDGNGRVDVADVQAVFSRIAPKLIKAPAQAKPLSPLTPSETPLSPLSPMTPLEPGTNPVAPLAGAAQVPLNLVVTTTADAVDANPGDKICAIAGGGCSLRAAIDEANRNPGPDTITFNIPGGAPQTIQLTLGKLTINQPGLTINGYSEPGAHANTDPIYDNALPGVEIVGNGDAAKESLYITTSGTVVTGLAMNRMWKTIWMSQGANNNTIAGNFVGMSATGANVGYSGLNGILMDAGANHNLIGLPTLAGRNVIGNVGEGIDFYNSGTDYNLSRNNNVGLSPDGTQAYGIGDNAMDHNFGPKNNTAGGFGPLDRNVFDSAGNDGVEYSHGWNQAYAPAVDTSLPYQINDNQLLGNYIGFKPDGSYDPSFADGQCWPGCESNDNGQGVNVIDGANRTIVNGNYITGNRNGVQIEAAWSTGNVIENNHIGISPNGMNSTINDNGVFVHWDTKGNTVANNDIRNAGKAGVALDSPSVYDDLITQNTYRNIGSGLAIDNYPLGVVNVNGAQPSGSDHAVFYPVITSVTTTSVSGTAPKGSVVEIYNTFAGPGSYGPGRNYLTSVTANASTGAFTASVSLNPGDVVTATATTGVAPTADTSEFGVNVAVPGAVPTVHGVTFSDWENFGGTALTNIPTGTLPNSVTTRGLMETPVNRGDNLGSRLQAYLTAPTTGTYTFWMASDDNGRLFLSTNSDPSNRQMIAHVDQWTNSEAWDTFPSQMSAPINLVAGQKYYIEAWSKEGGGGDNLAVAWSGPGISRQVITDDYLTATTDGCTGWCPNVPVTPYHALLTSFAGKCADVYGIATADGSEVTDYSCNSGINQTWTLASNGTLQVYNNPAKCLMPAGGSLTAGTPIVISTCDGSAAQTWSYSLASGTLKDGGLCLEVPGANSNDGVQLALNTCDGQPEQSWLFQAGPGYTPDPPSNVTASTTSVSGQTCADCTVTIYSSIGNVGDSGPGSATIGTTTADATGAFTLAVAGTLAYGTVITTNATTPLGVASNFSANVAVPPPPAPAAPTGLTADTGTISGNAEASSTVTLYTSSGNAGDNGPGTTLLGTVVATAGGTFSYTVTAANNLLAGQIVTATATNAGGPSGFAVNVAVTQALPPAPGAPTGLVATTSSISGSAQAASTVKIYTSTGNAGDNGPGSTFVASVVADPSGSFSYTVQPADNITAGLVVTATATNPGGTSGFAANVTVTPPAPAAPTALTADTGTISGNAEGSSTVTLYRSSGNAGDNGPGTTLLGTVVATAGGTFSYTVTAANNLLAGQIVTATATNAGGPSGFAVNVAVTQALPPAPGAPTGLVATTSSISGSAQAASTVKIYTSTGNAGDNGPGSTFVASVVADPSGSFSYTVQPADNITAGLVVTATATNPGGTSGFAANVTVTPPAPAAPTALTADTGTISGNAEASSTVKLYTSSGSAGANGPGTTLLATVPATPGGTFSWTVAPAGSLAAGTIVTATATNAGGTSGFAVNVAVAPVLPPAPAAPTGLNATTATVTGNAEAASTVSIYKSSGAAGASGPGTTLLGTVVATGGTFSWTVSPAGALSAGDVVTATATNAGGTGPFAVNVTTTAIVVPPLATDSFTRIIANGWGSATSGGLYSLFSTVADYAVDGSTGTMRLAAGNTRETWLNSISATNVNSTVTFSLDKLPVGANAYVYLTARRTAAGADYRGVIRLQPNGQVYAYITKYVGTTETTIGTIPLISGLTVAANTRFHARLVVTGTNPTTIKLTVWADGSAEPASPQITQTDSQPDLQVAGAAGLRAYVGAAITNAPETARFDDWSVTPAS